MNKVREKAISKVLFINACSNAESHTHQIASFFIDEYTKHHPNDEVIFKNLYEEKIRFLDAKQIKSRQSKDYKENPDDEEFSFVKEFKEADKIIIAAPFWNLSIPAILHAYLEHIAVEDITYKVSLRGTVGLCQGKRIVHIVTRGIYSSKIEYGDSYLRAFFATLGIKDFRTIALEGIDVHKGQEERFFERSIQLAKNIAEVW